MVRWPYTIAVLAAGWVLAGPAQAQTLSDHDWSGFHVGGGVGGTVGVSQTTTVVGPNSTYLTTTDPAQIADSGDGDLTQWRPSGGIELGYGRQFGNVFVGIEAGANTLFLKESRSAGQVYLSQPPARFTLDQKIEADWQAMVRPRLGWAQDDWLAFVSGGLAVTRVTLDTTFTDNFNNNAFGQGSNTETKVGWTLGLGGEYALNRDWSLRADYLYADFGSVDTSAQVTNSGNPGLSSVLDSSADLQTHTVLIGVTYRFDGF